MHTVKCFSYINDSTRLLETSKRLSMKQNIISFSVNDTRTPLLKSTCDNNGKHINSMQSFISRLTLGFPSLGLKRRERVLPLLILPFRLLPSPINCTLPPIYPSAESGSSLPSSYGSTDEHVETEAPLCE